MRSSLFGGIIAWRGIQRCVTDQFVNYENPVPQEVGVLPGQKTLTQALQATSPVKDLGKSLLVFFAEELDVGGALGYRTAFSALDEFTDLLDDIGVGQGGDVAGVHAVGDCG